MNEQKFLESSAAFPNYLNWGSSVKPHQPLSEQSVRFVDFSCYVNEFAVYQEPPKVEQIVVYK
ncbi:MAG: hypothetical protein LBB78_09050 [Spirochaetaceae bacterium]|jgi:hypothetical protein|nr:hypothetical protein [Spirochaetaceae bacterium]